MIEILFRNYITQNMHHSFRSCIFHQCSVNPLPPLIHPFPLVKRILSKTFPNNWILSKWWLIIKPSTVSKTSFHWSRKISPPTQFYNPFFAISILSWTYEKRYFQFIRWFNWDTTTDFRFWWIKFLEGF